MGAAFHGQPPRADPAARQRKLDELQQSGVLSEPEADALRARLGL